ncbi:SIR2 family protein [Nannocystis pusilla]|uniref:SIR2 family protein n=1 Tax=Nannocystis pusilla TaxID=889268 RepID=UPI003BF2F9A9
MIDMALSRLSRVQKEELQALLGANLGNRYGVAMSFLRQRKGQDELNELVRNAVFRAQKPKSTVWPGLLGWQAQELEEIVDLWHIPPGLKAFGKLVTNFGKRFGETILTTNFDPLIGIAIRNAGGHCVRVIMDMDGDISAMGGSVPRIVHLHGFWRNADTLHTEPQLAGARPRLEASLRTLLAGKTAIVMGYGGWDDVFTRALASIASEPASDTRVVWCFHETDPALIQKRYRSALGMLAVAEHGSVDYISGFDVNRDLPRLFDTVVGKELATRGVFRAFISEMVIKGRRSKVLRSLERKLGVPVAEIIRNDWGISEEQLVGAAKHVRENFPDLQPLLLADHIMQMFLSICMVTVPSLIFRKMSWTSLSRPRVTAPVNRAHAVLDGTSVSSTWGTSRTPGPESSR